MLFIVFSLLMLTALCVSLWLYKPERDQKIQRPQAFGGIVGIWIFGTMAMSFTIIQPGNTGLPVVLGVVDFNTTLASGPHIVNPMATIERYITARRTIDYTGENAIKAPSKDRVQVTIDVTATFRTNPDYVGIIRQQLGNGHVDRVLRPASRAAIRAASAQFNWSEAVITKRAEFAEAITREFKLALQTDLVKIGLSPKDAAAVYIIGHVQLRKAVPPARILASISERLAAAERLKTQDTLKEIAGKEAERRVEEGQGISNLLNSALGNDPGTVYDAMAVRIVLGAIADKTRADAMAAAVEAGSVKVMVMGGAASPAVNLPSTTPARVVTK